MTELSGALFRLRLAHRLTRVDTKQQDDSILLCTYDYAYRDTLEAMLL